MRTVYTLYTKRIIYIQQRNNNIFARLISRKNKNYDPRKKTVISQQERYLRGFIFSMYGLFIFFLFIPGSNYSIKSYLNDAFFERNCNLPNIITLDSGIQYKILKKGYGDKPKNRSSSVYVHYEGSLLNGTIFTSTKYSNKPIKFNLNQVIPGIAESIINMKIGEEKQIFIPSHLAYSRNGKINTNSFINIPPNTPIIFNIQLVDINYT